MIHFIRGGYYWKREGETGSWKMEQNREWVMICWLSFGVRFFSIFIFPFPVFGPWFLVPVPCVPFSVLPSPFSLRRCPFSVLRFPVFPFPVPRSPLPVLLVLRFSLFFSFISYWTTKRLFGSTSFLSNEKTKVRTSRCFHVLTDGFNSKICFCFFPCVCF